MEELFKTFEGSPDTLRVYDGNKLVISSRKDRLAPLLEYLTVSPRPAGVTIFDRIAGNAAALLAVKAGARALWSPLGSQNAALTLARYGIEAHIKVVVEAILQPGTGRMCPMEKLSIGQDPESFYKLLNRERGANVS
jgi:hypothetical protein